MRAAISLQVRTLNWNSFDQTHGSDSKKTWTMTKWRVLVFIDFRKAFDVIDHELLLKKLSIYGATPSSVAWFKSYLSERKQFISLRKTTSKQLTVKQGVPQGSILGPVLFLLFVNDMPLHVQKSTMDIYADDTTLSLSSNWKTLPLLNQSLSQDLNEVERWARENKMYLNMQKTKALLVTGKRLRKRMVQDPGKLGVKRITQKLNKSQTINWSDSAFYAILAPT